MTDGVRFACGIDIGVKNLAISFVELCETGEARPRIISYKGTLDTMLRFEEGGETQVLKLTGKKLSHHDSYITIFETMPEFEFTTTTVIEMQLAMGRSDMSRLDGVAYGFLRGRYPSMIVTLNGSTIRKKFITDAITGLDFSTVSIPRGYPETKRLSLLFVGCKFSQYYEFIQSLVSDLDKIDDVCDSVVYASIALVNHLRTKAAPVATRARKVAER